MCIASCLHLHALASLPLMGRPKFRTFRDLYQYIITHQPSQPFEFEMEEKSRSCNVCDTWCSLSLIVHIEQVAATAGVGIDDFTDKTYEGKGTSKCSSKTAFGSLLCRVPDAIVGNSQVVRPNLADDLVILRKV